MLEKREALRTVIRACSNPARPKGLHHTRSRLIGSKFVGNVIRTGREVVPRQQGTSGRDLFYNNAVSAGDLKLRLTIESSSKDDVTDKQFEEIRAALAGLFGR